MNIVGNMGEQARLSLVTPVVFEELCYALVSVQSSLPETG